MAKKKATPKVRKGAKPPSPVWDLYRDGISYSLLANFVGDRERFRLKTVEGLASREFSVPMEWGNLFHDMIEYRGASDRQHKLRTTKWKNKLIKSRFLTPRGIEDLEKLIQVVQVYWPRYLEHWKPVDDQIVWIEPEHEFKENYRVYPFRTLKLRGKIDGVIEREGRPWIFETKTKTDLPVNSIIDMLPHNMQTMMYSLVMQNKLRENIGGVLWNGIKRPTIKQTQKETFEEYLTRLGKDIENRPEWYFLRCQCRFFPGDVSGWQKQTFDPLIVSLIQWWESIRKNPFDPWHVKVPVGQLQGIDSSQNLPTDENELVEIPNPHHWQRPYGTFDPMSHGYDDYFEYLTTGSRGKLKRVSHMFPELSGK